MIFTYTETFYWERYQNEPLNNLTCLKVHFHNVLAQLNSQNALTNLANHEATFTLYKKNI